ncbi:UNVERIFIED_CONTAM: hypothetical protein FKN15_031608 [Acipenser sinensis]
MDGITHRFSITYSSSDKSHQDTITAPSNSTVISNLRPRTEYTFTVTTELENGTQSKSVQTAFCTELSPPGNIKIDSVENNTVSLSWGSPDSMDGITHRFSITYSSSDKSHQDTITAPSNSTVISNLRPGRQYTFTVTTELENGTQSKSVQTAFCTELSPPGNIKIDSVENNTVSLSWGSPDSMDGITHRFSITYSSSDKSHQDTITAPSNSTVISNLRPRTEYTFTVTTELENGTQSKSVSTAVCTGPSLQPQRDTHALLQGELSSISAPLRREAHPMPRGDIAPPHPRDHQPSAGILAVTEQIVHFMEVVMVQQKFMMDMMSAPVTAPAVVPVAAAPAIQDPRLRPPPAPVLAPDPEKEWSWTMTRTPSPCRLPSGRRTGPSQQSRHTKQHQDLGVRPWWRRRHCGPERWPQDKGAPVLLVPLGRACV